MRQIKLAVRQLSGARKYSSSYRCTVCCCCTCFAAASRSDNFVVGLTNVSASDEAPVLWSYPVCGQYAGSVPADETVLLPCNGTDLPPARYVVVQFPTEDHMNFCEIDVCANGTPTADLNHTPTFVLVNTGTGLYTLQCALKRD